MKNHLGIFAAAALAFSSASTFAGALETYFPLNDGDQKLFVYESSLPLTLSVSAFGYDDMQGNPLYGMKESYGNTTVNLTLADDATDGILYFTGVPGWTHVSFAPEVVLLNDNILANGGTVKTSTEATQTGIKYPATFIMKVAKVASLKVQGVTYTDCRSITCSEVADVRGQTVSATALTAYLAPGVGIVKTLLSGGQWAELVSGVVGGVPVGSGDLSQITVGAGADGNVSPNYNNQLLAVGHAYAMTAKPKSGYILGTWTDGNYNTVGTMPKLTFTMQNNLVLQANFVQNPFVAPAGTYTGLFSPAVGPTVRNSGYCQFTPTSTGGFSGYFLTGTTRHSISGQFDANGTSTNVVNVTGQAPWTVRLNLDLWGGNVINGTISNENWTGQLNANKSVFSATKDPATLAGDYTLTFEGAGGPTNLPGGNGYANAAISKAGAVALSGCLADGSAITPSATLSQYGQWPLYASLYGGAGSVSGWMSVNNSGAISGNVVWIKPESTKGNYPGGFTFSTTASGGPYAKSNAASNTNFTKAVFSGGALASPFANQIAIGSNQKVTNQSSNKLTMTFSPSTGSFQGTVVNPAAPGSGAMPFGGILLPKQNTALGWFLDAGQSGTFTLEPR